MSIGEALNIIQKLSSEVERLANGEESSEQKLEEEEATSPKQTETPLPLRKMLADHGLYDAIIDVPTKAHDPTDQMSEALYWSRAYQKQQGATLILIDQMEAAIWEAYQLGKLHGQGRPQ